MHEMIQVCPVPSPPWPLFELSATPVWKAETQRMMCPLDSATTRCLNDILESPPWCPGPGQEKILVPLLQIYLANRPERFSSCAHSYSAAILNIYWRHVSAPALSLNSQSAYFAGDENSTKNVQCKNHERTKNHHLLCCIRNKFTYGTNTRTLYASWWPAILVMLTLPWAICLEFVYNCFDGAFPCNQRTTLSIKKL